MTDTPLAAGDTEMNRHEKTSAFTELIFKWGAGNYQD